MKLDNRSNWICFLLLQVMVIIKRDDYISFINSTGVKMPMTPANDNISTQPPGNGGAQIPPINNNNNAPPSNQAANVSTIKRGDSSQQQLQQLQAYAQNQQNLAISNQNQSLAKAQLVCRPNSHPFPVSFIAQF
jgi:hypothetical protein